MNVRSNEITPDGIISCSGIENRDTLYRIAGDDITRLRHSASDNIVCGASGN